MGSAAKCSCVLHPASRRSRRPDWGAARARLRGVGCGHVGRLRARADSHTERVGSGQLTARPLLRDRVPGTGRRKNEERHSIGKVRQFVANELYQNKSKGRASTTSCIFNIEKNCSALERKNKVVVPLREK